MKTNCRRIGLRDRAGRIKAYALVSPVDYERLSQYRWSLDSGGYVVRTAKDGSKLYMHREVLGLTKGDGLFTDHINRNKRDNRRPNLRLVSHMENCHNSGAHRDAVSKHRGVSPHKRSKKWQAHSMINGNRKFLGLFTSELAAARAVNEYRAEHAPLYAGVTS
jgi:hypothetical protein